MAQSAQFSASHQALLAKGALNNPQHADKMAYNAYLAYLTFPDASNMDDTMFKAMVESPAKAIHNMSYLSQKDITVAFDKVAVSKIFMSEQAPESPISLFFEHMTTTPGVNEVELLKIVQGDANRFDGSNPVAYGSTALSRTFDDRKVSFTFERFAELIELEPHAMMRDFQGATAKLNLQVGTARNALQIAANNEKLMAVLRAPPSMIVHNPNLSFSDKSVLAVATVADLVMFLPSLERGGKSISTAALTYASRGMAPGNHLSSEYAIQKILDMLRMANPDAHLDDILQIWPKHAAILERYGSSVDPAFFENGKRVLMENDGRVTDGGIVTNITSYETASIEAFRRKNNLSSPGGEVSEWTVMPSAAMPKAASAVGSPKSRSLNIVGRSIVGSGDAHWKLVSGKTIMENIQILDRNRPGIPYANPLTSDAFIALMRSRRVAPTMDANRQAVYDPFYTFKRSAVQTSTPAYQAATHFGAVSDAFLSKEDAECQARNFLDVILRDFMTPAEVQAIDAMIKALVDNSTPPGSIRGVDQAAAWAWAFANSGSVGPVPAGTDIQANNLGFHDLPVISTTGTVAIGVIAGGNVTFGSPIAGDGNDAAIGDDNVAVKVISNGARFRLVGASGPSAARSLAELSLNGVPASWSTAFPQFTQYLAVFEAGWAALHTMAGHALRLSPSSAAASNLVLSGAIIPGGPDPAETDTHVIAMSGIITAFTGGLASVWTKSGSNAREVVVAEAALFAAAGFSDDASAMLGEYSHALRQGKVQGAVPAGPRLVPFVALINGLADDRWKDNVSNSNSHRMAISTLSKLFVLLQTGGDATAEIFAGLNDGTTLPTLRRGDFESLDAGANVLKRTRLGIDYRHVSNAGRAALAANAYGYGSLASPTTVAGSGDFAADLAAMRAALHDSPLGRSLNELPRSYRTESLLWQYARTNNALTTPAMVDRVRRSASMIDGASTANAFTRAGFLLYLCAPMSGTAMGCLAEHGISSAVRGVVISRSIKFTSEMAFIGFPKCGMSFVVKYTGDATIKAGERTLISGSFSSPVPAFSGDAKVTASTTQITSAVSDVGKTFIELARVTGSSLTTPSRVIAMAYADMRSVVSGGDFSFSPADRENMVVSYMGLSETEKGTVAPLHGYVHEANARLAAGRDGYVTPFSGLLMTMTSTNYATTFDGSPSQGEVNLGGEDVNSNVCEFGLQATNEIMALNSYRGPQASYDGTVSPGILDFDAGASPFSHVLPFNTTLVR